MSTKLYNHNHEQYMSNRRYLHHLWRRLQIINPWLLSGLFLVFAAISVAPLRHNNLEMVRLRNEVTVADEFGGDVEAALRALREHVHNHMNTDLTGGDLAIYPPIQLKYRYERLVAAERERVATVNGQIYTQAQIECEKRFPAGLSGSSRIPCIQEYVASAGIKEQPIPDALYKFDFIGPRWSPDLAGWSVLLSAIFFVLFLLRIIAGWWLRANS